MGYDLNRVFSLAPGGASKNVNIEDAKVRSCSTLHYFHDWGTDWQERVQCFVSYAAYEDIGY